MSRYDDSRRAIPDLLDAVDADTGLTIAQIIRAKHGYQPPSLQIGRADIERPRDWSDADALVDEFGREELTKAAALFTATQGR